MRGSLSSRSSQTRYQLKALVGRITSRNVHNIIEAGHALQTIRVRQDTSAISREVHRPGGE